MEGLMLGSSIQEDIERVNLAFELEKAHPKLDFYEINNLVEVTLKKQQQFRLRENVLLFKKKNKVSNKEEENASSKVD